MNQFIVNQFNSMLGLVSNFVSVGKIAYRLLMRYKDSFSKDIHYIRSANEERLFKILAINTIASLGATIFMTCQKNRSEAFVWLSMFQIYGNWFVLQVLVPPMYKDLKQLLLGSLFQESPI